MLFPNQLRVCEGVSRLCIFFVLSKRNGFERFPRVDREGGTGDQAPYTTDVIAGRENQHGGRSADSCSADSWVRPLPLSPCARDRALNRQDTLAAHSIRATGPVPSVSAKVYLSRRQSVGGDVDAARLRQREHEML